MKKLWRLLGSRKQPDPVPAASAEGWPFASLARSTKAFDRAQSAARSNHWDEADRHLRDVEADPPDRLKFLTLKADVAAARQDWATSEACWQAVIDEFPEMTDAYGAKATAIRVQGRTIEAVAGYLLAMEKAPTSLGPPSMLAHMLEHLPPELSAELVRKLSSAFDRHLKDRRNGALALWSKGKVARAGGNLVDAIGLLRAAQAAALTNPEIASDLAAMEARFASQAKAAKPLP